jgi:hypothetical protein
MTSLLRLVPFSLLCVTPLATLAAQGQARAAERAPERAPARAAATEVPRDMLPPAGKCRIWMDGVAPAQQPAPTDCQTALRQRPANGTVVFGPAAKEPPARGFSAPRPANTPPRSDSSSPRSDSSSRRRRPEPRF